MLTDEEIAKMKNCLPFALDPTLPNEAKLQMVQSFDDLQTARRDLRELWERREAKQMRDLLEKLDHLAIQYGWRQP